MKKEIVICLGSSCFSRGSKLTVQIIKDYIRNHQLDDKVIFKGNHCNEDCKNGPILKIDGKIYQHVSPKNVVYILENLFSKSGL